MLSEGDLNRASRGKDVVSVAYCVGFPCRMVADERQREVEKLAQPEVSANALTMWRDWPFVLCAALKSTGVAQLCFSAGWDCLIGNVIKASV